MDTLALHPPREGRPRRLLSLKWQALVLISLVLVVINAAFYLLQSANLEGTFARERNALRATHVGLFEGLLRDAERRMQQTGELMPLFAGMAPALSSQNMSVFDTAFEPLWPSLQLGVGIDGVAFIGSDGRLISRWGEVALIGTRGRIDELVRQTLSREQPASTIECQNICAQYVLVPLLVDHLAVGVMVLSASLAGPIIQFSELTRSDIGIMVAGGEPSSVRPRGSRRLEGWNLDIVALTGFASSWPVLEAAAASSTGVPELGRLTRMAHGDRRYEVVLFPLTRLASEAGGFFIFLTDIEDQVRQIALERDKALTIGVVGLVVSEAALLAILWVPLSRLRRTARALPTLARQDYAEARRLLGKQPRRRLFENEIDQVEGVALELTDQLEQLNDAVLKRTTALREKVSELASERDFVSGLLNTAQVIILTQGKDGIIHRSNQFAQAVSGFAGEALHGRTFAALSRLESPAATAISQQIAEVAMGKRRHFEHESLLACRDGSTREIAWIHSHLRAVEGQEPAVLSVGLDITARRKADQSIAWLASHDPLTGLYNRHRFQAEFDRVLRESRRHKRSGALLFIDLDHFKFINDTLGHDVGDMLLKTAAVEIRRLLRESDVVARFGGDEFVALLSEVDQADAVGIAEKINFRLGRVKLTAVGAAHRISASIGIAMFHGQDETGEDLLKNADVAMYHVKETRRGDAHVYSGRELLRERLARQLYLKNATQQALADDRFELFYQPIVEIASGEITHYEALLRMIDERGEIVLPQPIIEGAEKSGLIRAIDHLVLRKAVAHLQSERAKGRNLHLAVNLSASAFSDPDLLPLLKRLLDGSGVEAGQLIVEITETAALADFSAACTLIEAMRNMGCRFALDDFGAGFSSFYYLKQLPVDYVKIDGAFIQSLARSRDDQILVKAISDIAKGFGKQTIAEFVEDAETLEILRGYDVNYAQGYFLGRPDRMVA